MFLDSGKPGSEQGRYDILVAEPRYTFVVRGPVTRVCGPDGCSESTDDPLTLLRTLLGKQRPAPPHGLPFACGAVGYFAYDLGRRFESLPRHAHDAEGTPMAALGIYSWSVVVDHHERRTWLLGDGMDADLAQRWQSLCARMASMFEPRTGIRRAGLGLAAPWSSNLERGAYGVAFRRIQSYIRAGDCYQVNLAQRFSAPAQGDPWESYRALRTVNPAPFAAYLNLPGIQVLSASPERFLRVETDGGVQSKPIKGTIARDDDPARDRVSRDTLRNSLKDRAENLMIVDLIRNDLGRTCAVGSIRVPALFQVESFATVHHLVSTVSGRLAAGRDALDLLRGAFPGGSITGAPKLRAMAIIEELEPHRRGIYCGAIGYLGRDGAMDLNIAIRTLVYSDGVLRFWAGGGIVADSQEEAEFRETHAKAAALFQAIANPPG